MAENKNKRLVVRNKEGTFQITLDEIIFMEKNLRKIIIHTKHRDIEFYGKYSDILHYVDDRFLCCHRSYMFNMDEIVIMAQGGVFMTDNSNIYLGRDTFTRGNKTFHNYLKRKFDESGENT
jgi:DNA-binding LytR/AlgR family response regulator